MTNPTEAPAEKKPENKSRLWMILSVIVAIAGVVFWWMRRNQGTNPPAGKES